MDLCDIADGLMKGHLGFLSHHLKQEFPFADFYFTDASGNNRFFWLEESSCFSVQKAHTAEHAEGPISYNPQTKLLLYRIDYNSVSFCICAEGVTAKTQSDVIVSYLNEILPAIRRYLSLYQIASENLTSLVLPLYSQLFTSRTFSVEKFFELTHDYLDPSKEYYVVARAFDNSNIISPYRLTNLAHSLIRDKGAQVFNFIHEDRSLQIISTDPTYSPDDNRSYRKSPAIIHKRTQGHVDPEYNVQCGVGTPKKAADLYDSYKEAMLALCFGSLEKRTDFVLVFDELGGIVPILSQPVQGIIDYCRSVLGPLLKRDKSGKENYLLSTLRAFLQCCLQYTKAAEMLYVHPNTMRYRILKAFTLLGYDPENMYDIASIYLAIQAWDLLAGCDFFGINISDAAADE